MRRLQPRTGVGQHLRRGARDGDEVALSQAASHAAARVADTRVSRCDGTCRAKAGSEPPALRRRVPCAAGRVGRRSSGAWSAAARAQRGRNADATRLSATAAAPTEAKPRSTLSASSLVIGAARSADGSYAWCPSRACRVAACQFALAPAA